MNTSPLSPLLQVEGVSLSFGGLRAVSDFRLALAPGDLQGLIGPNGAGKTTVFNLITGVYRPDSGSIRVGEQRIEGLKPWKIARAGVARTFQNIRLFKHMSVLDNVRVACHLRSRHKLAESILRAGRYYGDDARLTGRAHELLAALNLGDRAHEVARNLPYGDQRRLEIARALATEPKVLLLDEPAAGMNTVEKKMLSGLIRGLRERFKVTILLIEHDMGVVMSICEKITVLDHGQIISFGEPAAVQRDPKVIEAYLGEAAAKTE